MKNKFKNSKDRVNKSKEYLIEFRNEEVITRLINPSFEIITDPPLKKNKRSSGKKNKTNFKTK